VSQDTFVFDQNSWLKTKTLTALIHAQTSLLLSMDYQPGQELPGKIVIRESNNPFSSDGDRDLKYAGSTKVLCRVDDQPVYRKTFYTEDLTQEHTLIQHTNSDEIKAKLAQMKSTMKHIRGPVYEVASF
jgi:hypothetical protein